MHTLSPATLLLIITGLSQISLPCSAGVSDSHVIAEIKKNPSTSTRNNSNAQGINGINVFVTPPNLNNTPQTLLPVPTTPVHPNIILPIPGAP